MQADLCHSCLSIIFISEDQDKCKPDHENKHAMGDHPSFVVFVNFFP